MDINNMSFMTAATKFEKCWTFHLLLTKYILFQRRNNNVKKIIKLIKTLNVKFKKLYVLYWFQWQMLKAPPLITRVYIFSII